MLKHNALKNTSVVTRFGRIDIDKEGFAKKATKEQEKVLGDTVAWTAMTKSELEEKKADAKDKEAELQAEAEKRDEAVEEAKEDMQAGLQREDKVEDPINTTTPKAKAKAPAKRATRKQPKDE